MLWLPLMPRQDCMSEWAFMLEATLSAVPAQPAPENKLSVYETGVPL